MTPAPRWITDTEPGHSEWYIQRFREMAADGADLFGEARFVDAMVGRGSRLLDAGCGPGRVGGYLHTVGHRVTGVDVDPTLIEAAEADYPGPDWRVGDLAELDLREPDGSRTRFDAIVCAGNVLAFVAPDTEAQVLRRLGEHLAPTGRLAVGFHVAKLALADFDAALAETDLVLDLRLATWDLRPWHDDADFAVSILRH
ncbi:class I SAM-dependent methyltransferase [Gordonia hydrophobica]|uniref:Class I SAM-dependent methyltransferase n=1 Tax=Gordonia hydrophobica TaxID=40516 RepID=A0ABZ2U2B6_9ACTN|nr:class I SAM-dependent methyltransferase [Gordonia hydrophobica]MBM7366910.1 2-polyprenyl-3-methyl-5-hydroxy-6-metoxy-1,4-benzoquinol methylase [Gordonia hydrophobica]